MCGIAGLYSFKNNDEYDPRLYVAMTNMGLHMQNRGRKSWGWTNGTDIVKSLGEFENGWNYGFASPLNKQMALHTRYPTQGELIAENCHPFEIGNIIGMHNGIVHNHFELQRRYERSCNVDSEHIFHHINENRSLNDISAYGAIVFWRDGFIHLGRFNGGDLSLARTADTWLFASTENAVKQSARFAGLTKDFVLCKLKLGQLYRLNGPNLELAGDLNFGDYNSTRSWQSGYGASTDDSDAWGGYYDASKYRRQYGSTNITKTSTVIEAKPKVEDEKKDTDTLTKIRQMITGTIVKDRAIEGKNESKVEEKNSLVGSSTDDSWICGFCQTPFNQKIDRFHFTIDYDIICIPCANKFPAHVKSKEILRNYPSDIVKVSAMLDTKEIMMNIVPLACDTCGESFLMEETAVFMSEDTIICTSCFSEGAAEEIEATDAEYLDYVEESKKEKVYFEDDTQKIHLTSDSSIQITNKMTGEFQLISQEDATKMEAISKYVN